MATYLRHILQQELKSFISPTHRFRLTHLDSVILFTCLRSNHTTHITAAKFIELVNHKTKRESQLRKACLHGQQHSKSTLPQDLSSNEPSNQTPDLKSKNLDRFGTLSVDQTPVHESLAPRIHSPKSELVLDSLLKDDLEPDPGDRPSLSRTNRRHPPEYYLNEIIKFCKKEDISAALSVLFDSMLTEDRVMPSRMHFHVLLDGLIKVGDSENAFRAYKQMLALQIEPTQATYSRLFRAAAEDINCWFKTNRHLLPPAVFDLGGSPLKKRKNLALQAALAPDIPVDSFGGPAVFRVHKLWSKLSLTNTPLTKATYNALILALAKAGDIQGCLRALDQMLLGKNLTPDSYTLTAILSAIEPATICRRLSCLTSTPNPQPIITDYPPSAFEFVLNVWHTLIPALNYLPIPQHFSLLVRAMSVIDDFPGSKSDLPLSIQIDSQPTSLRLLTGKSHELAKPEPNRIKASIWASCEAAERLLHDAARSADTFRVSQQSQTIDDPKLESCSSSSSPMAAETSDLPSSIPAVQNVSTSDVRIWSDWTDSKLALKSPINLLLPFKGKIVVKPPPTGVWLPWHRLALLGGLHGFFDAMENRYKVAPGLPLITNLIAVLPQPQFDDSLIDHFDSWETELLRLMSDRKLKPDLTIYNALISRRTRAGIDASFLLAELVRVGFIPDQITWGALAIGCTKLKTVQQLYKAYCDASRQAGSTDSGMVRPNLTFFASMLAGSGFQWDVKLFVLKMMLGPHAKTMFKQVHKEKSNLKNKKSKISNPDNLNDKAEVEDDPNLQVDQEQFEGIAPNRRLIASIDVDVSLFRRLVAQGVVPSDGSPVSASKTGGIDIPPFALENFHTFIPVYKQWLRQSPVEDSTP